MNLDKLKQEARECTCSKDGFNDAGIDTYGCPIHSEHTLDKLKQEAREIAKCPFCGKKGQIRKSKKKYCQLHGDEYQNSIVGCFNSQCEVQPSVEKPTDELCLDVWNNQHIATTITDEMVKRLEEIKLDFIARWEHPDHKLPIENEVKTETIYHLTKAQAIIKDSK